MALSPQKTREYLFQLLYSWDLNPDPLSETHPDDWAKTMQTELRLSAKELAALKTRASAIIEHYPTLDPLLAAQSSEAYEFSRIQSVEKTVLRLALYEIMIEKIIPPKVSIAEAIRLSRKFSTAESAHFINAILDALYKKQK